MITSVDIENFQSHEKTHIDFDAGVNALVGLSDSGKTTVIRALRWVLFNRPGGDAFRSYWGGPTTVTITLSSGDTIARHKDKENLYIVNGKELAGFGQDVPEEVQRLLNINDINFASQLDGPFMLGNSSGEVAQQLNKAAQLDIIDKSASFLRKKLSGINSDLKYEEVQLTQQETHLESFAFIPHLESDLKKLEQSHAILSSREKESIALSNLVARCEETLEQIETIKCKIPPTKDVQQLEQACTRLEQKVSAQRKIDALLDEIDVLQEVLEKNAVDDKALWSCAVIEKLLEQRRELVIKRKAFADICEKIREQSTFINFVETDLVELREEFDEDFPDVCPLCEK